MKRKVMGMLGAGLLLAGCGQQSTVPQSDVPAAYRDQTGAAWTYTARSGQSTEGQLKPLSLGMESGLWSYTLSANSGWGPIEINASNGEKAAGDGRPLTMGGEVYQTGLGLHADAEISLSGSQPTGVDCDFSADVGVDDEVGNRGSVVFQAYADGVKLYDSGVLRGSDAAARHVAFTFPSAKSLSIRVTDAGDHNYFDHADIANPLLTCRPVQAKPTLTLDVNELTVYHLHTAALHATFKNFPAGKVQLRLVGDPVPVVGSQPPRSVTLPFALQTHSVDLMARANQTRDVVVGAPLPLNYYDTNQELFHLIASVNGQDVTQADVTLRQLPIKFTATIDPATITAHSGEEKSFVLTVTADPPLSGPQPLRPDAGNGRLGGFEFKVISVEPVTGDGGTMRTVVHFLVPTFNAGGSLLPVTLNAVIGVAVGDITTGYRSSYYGNSPNAALSVTVIP